MAVATMRHEPSPQYPAIKPGMMGMYIFLASEVMFFGSMFATYFYLVGSHPTWPPIPPSSTPEYYVHWYPIPLINTFLLAGSSISDLAASSSFFVACGFAPDRACPAQDLEP